MKLLPVVNRQCGECTKCCEGWLAATVYDHLMGKGSPCFYLDGHCTIYEDRPDVCRKYSCSWRTEDIFPMWMKPSIVGVIITKIPRIGTGPYYEVTEAGNKMSADVLNYLVQWAIRTGTDLHYELSGQYYSIGTEQFKSEMRNKI